MDQIISIMGYAPRGIKYCPRCGNRRIDLEFNGAVTCNDCGLEVYIIEGDNSEDFED